MVAVGGTGECSIGGVRQVHCLLLGLCDDSDHLLLGLRDQHSEQTPLIAVIGLPRGCPQ
jgi:hypothetical protein